MGKTQSEAGVAPSTDAITTKPTATESTATKPTVTKPTATNSTETKSITTMAYEYGVTLRALRFYEERGMLAPARNGNDRLYRPSDELKVRLILDGKRLGFSLLEIEELLVRFDKALVPSFILSESLRPAEIEQQLKSLIVRRDSVTSAIKQLEGLL